MVKFLLIFFLFLPQGVAVVNNPEMTLESCQKHSKELLDKATANNVPAVGGCIVPEDYIMKADV